MFTVFLLLATGKMSELHSLSLQKDIDIISLSETWLTSAVPDRLLSIDGFSFPFRCDRDRPYGGVAVYVSNSLCAQRLSDLEFPSVESVWLSVEVEGKNILIGTYYRPPGQTSEAKQSFLNYFSISVERALKQKPFLLLIKLEILMTVV